MKRTCLCLAVVLAATAPLALGQETRPSKTDPAEWVPADALFYLGVTDVGQTCDDFKKTAAYAAMSDASAGEALPSLKLFGKAIEKFKERLAKALDLPAAQLKNPFGGALAVCLVVPAGSKLKDVEPVLVAGIGDKEAMKKYVDTAVTKFKEQGKYEAVSVGPATIQSFKFEADKEKKKPKSAGEQPDEEFNEADEEREEEAPFTPGGSPEQMIMQGIDKFFSAEALPPSLALCLTEDRLVVGTSVDQVKAALRREPGGKTLADADDHKALLRHFKDPGTVRVLVNLPRIIELAKTGATEDEREDLNKTLKVIGAESLGSVIAHWRGGAAGYDSKLEALFMMRGERSGLAKILSLENRASAPPAGTAADACVYASLNVKVPELIDEIERMLRQTDPNAADEMRTQLEEVELPSGEKFNVRKDFIAHLRGPLTVSLGFTKPVGPDCARLLVGLGHRDQNAMVRFFSSFGEMFQQRDVRGTQVFDVAMPPGLSIAPTNDRLVAGNTAAVAAALQPAAAGESLAETEAWKRAARHIPEESWLTVFVDERKLLEVALDAAKIKDQLMGGQMGPDMGSAILMGIAQGMAGALEEKDLEQARKLLKYSSQTVFTIATTPEGIRLTQVELKPAE
jgi:hypothetical protein